MIQKGLMHIRDCEIWGHTHRMYLLGTGSCKYPWQVPMDIPESSLHKVTMSRFLSFVKND